MFPVGAVVELKSGGPAMTVTESTDEITKCAYFEKYDTGTWGGCMRVELKTEGLREVKTGDVKPPKLKK